MSSKSFKKLDKLANIHNLVLKKTIRKNEKKIFSTINLIFQALQKKKNIFICGNGITFIN